MKYLFRLTFALIVFASFAITQSTGVDAAFPGYNGKIVFDSSVDGDREIYVMNADGTELEQLTHNTFNDGGPEWSPDGTKILFWSSRDGNNEIYVMNADGSNPINLTNNSANDAWPDWSPDGSKISFNSDRDGANGQIYTMNADGSEAINISDNLTYNDVAPQWSSDGSALSFWRRGGGENDVFVMDADGSNQQNLTNSGAQALGGSWSPDGSRIVYEHHQGGSIDIYAIDVDGNNKVQLTNFAGVDRHPQWSPDGTAIMFYSARDGGGVFTMDAEGSNIQSLYSNGGANEPDWQSIPNTSPNITNDTLATFYNSSEMIDVLANDRDEEVLDPSNLTISLHPENGSAEIDNGKIKYFPNPSFVGEDSLKYKICDSFMLDQKCGEGVLSITVHAGEKPKMPIVTKVGTVDINGTTKVFYTGHRPTFSGTSDPYAEVTVEIHSDPIILTTQADASGHWSVTPGVDIPNGEHTVKITSTKDGATSDPVTFTLGINVGLADTGVPLWPVSVIGLVGAGYVGYRRYVAKK